MMTKLFLRLILLCLAITHFIPLSVRAQNSGTDVAGIVRNQSGASLPGVTVLVKNSRNDFTAATQTDSTGVFTFSRLPSGEGYSFTISYVGMETQTLSGYILKPGSTLSITVKLNETATALNDVVVIGYGTTSRANLTTAISKINPAEIPSAANNSVNQLLFGRAAGLQATQNSSEPGGNINLSVRGRGAPLIIVDGIVVPNNELEPSPGITELNGVRRGGIANLNPNDIESIEVLKDASAAIYGVAASNGVILITTKKGKNGKMNVSYNGSYSTVKNMKYMEPLSPAEYMYYYNIFSKDVYGATTSKYSDADMKNAGAGTDWLGLVLRDGSIDNHSLSISGGSDKINYYISGGYFNQIGTMENSDLKRYSIKSNVTVSLASFLKLNTNLNYSRNYYTNSTAGWQNGGSGGQGFGALQAAVNYPKILPVRDSLGNYTLFATTGNPVSLLSISDKTNASTVFGSASLEADIIPKVLSAKLLYGNNFENAGRNFYIPSDVFYAQIYQSRGSLANNQRQNQTMEATLSFKKNIGTDLDVNAIAGYGQYLYDDNGSGLTATDMLDAIGTNNMGAAPTRVSMVSYKNFEKRRSYFSRVNLGYLDRYLLSLAYRADGIDKFFPANKYASFPSASVGWKLSSEKFMQGVKFINLLKLRASAGVTGLPIGSAAYGQYSPDAGNQAVFDNGATIYTPYYQTALDQPNLKWQKTVNTNIGLDFGFLNNRISGSFDVFRDKITNLLTRRSTNQLSYIASAYDNGGSQTRSGIEFSARSTNISTKNFKWDMITTVTHYRWRWNTRYNNQDLQPYVAVKDPVNAIYVYQTNGIIQTGETPKKYQPAKAIMPGAPKFVDRNGDDTLNYKDVVMYNRDPKVIIGLGNSFTYKNFDLSVFFYAQYGAKDFNYGLQWSEPLDFGGGTKGATVQIRDRWSSVNPNGTLPGGKFVESALGLPVSLDTYLSSKDFVRCRNLTLGYTFRGDATKKYFSSFRVYADVQNAFIITKYVAIDPEVTAASIKGGPAPYPMARTYSLGVNINF